jgi:hypothetical protein
MPNERTALAVLVTAWLGGVAALAVGCRQGSDGLGAPPRDAGPNEPTTRPQTELESLRVDNELLLAERRELRRREKRLCDEVNQLRFVNDQLAAQVAALAEAAAQRDALNAKVVRLQRQVEALQREIAELKRRARPAPGSRPAGRARPGG